MSSSPFSPSRKAEIVSRATEIIEIYNDYSSVHARLAQKWKASFSHQSPFSLSLGAQRSGVARPTSMVAPKVRAEHSKLVAIHLKLFFIS